MGLVVWKFLLHLCDTPASPDKPLYLQGPFEKEQGPPGTIRSQNLSDVLFAV